MSKRCDDCGGDEGYDPCICDAAAKLAVIVTALAKSNSKRSSGMTSWELVAKSILEGVKLREVDMEDGEYVYFDKESQQWLDQDGEECDFTTPEPDIELFTDRTTQTFYTAVYKDLTTGHIKGCTRFFPSRAELEESFAGMEILEVITREIRA